MIPGWEWVGAGALADPDGRLVAVAGHRRTITVDRVQEPANLRPLNDARVLPPEPIDPAAGPFVLAGGAALPERTGWRLVAAADGYLLDARAVRLGDVKVTARAGEPLLASVVLFDVAGTWRVLDG